MKRDSSSYVVAGSLFVQFIHGKDFTVSKVPSTLLFADVNHHVQVA